MIQKTCRENLAAIVAAYRKATGDSIEQVSRRFYGNRTFLREFNAKEQSVSIGKFDKIVAAFIAAWPENAEWPLLRVAVITGPIRRRRKKNFPRRAGDRDTNHLPPSDHEQAPT